MFAGETICPFREERLVQYCTAEPVPRYVPSGPTTAIPCGSEGYRFCPSYRAMAGAGGDAEEVAAGVAVLAHLYYSANHLWLSVSPGGECHVGVDALLARLLSPIERATFLTKRGVNKPSAILTVRGVDWPVVFPVALMVESANLHLRANPRRISDDPYGTGWLFGGWIPPGVSEEQATQSLLKGRRAVAWMRQESERLADSLSALVAPTAAGMPVASDGGFLAEGVAHLLSRDDLLSVLHEYFSSHRAWAKDT